MTPRDPLPWWAWLLLALVAYGAVLLLFAEPPPTPDAPDVHAYHTTSAAGHVQEKLGKVKHGVGTDE